MPPRTRQIKMIGQRKTGRNAPYKWFKLPRGLSSGILPLSQPMCLFTCIILFPLNEYLICFTTFCICGNSFLQSWGTRALVTDYWSQQWPSSISGWKSKPRFKVLQAEATRDYWDPKDCSLSVSSVHAILRARILEWVFLNMCGWGGLLVLGMRDMWSGKGPASSLNCPAILVLEFQSIGNESPNPGIKPYSPGILTHCN